jgi:hypothetical protein
MRLADISWPSGRERAAECIPGPTERTFVYSLKGLRTEAFSYGFIQRSNRIRRIR